jgi:hypothetical protein
VRKKFDLDMVIILGATACVLLGCLAYVIVFWRYPLGGPSSWSDFGQFFGGVAGPVCSLAAAWLLVRTLLVTRNANADAEERHKREERLAIHKARLSDALVEWERLMDTEYSGPIGLEASGQLVSIGPRSFRVIFANPEMLRRAQRAAEADLPPPQRIALNNAFLRCANLLNEFAEYCTEIDKLDPSREVSKYYRRRLQDGVHFLSNARHIGDATFAALNVPRHLGNIGVHVG